MSAAVDETASYIVALPDRAPKRPPFTGEAWYADDQVTVYHHDCRDVLRTLPDNSVDAIITDPPYDLTSGKKGGSGAASLNTNSPAGRSRIGTGGGFMGNQWDATGVAFDPATWAEAYRVLKPGGHLLAFGASRTSHRMVCAIEDAGFEIRPPLYWMHAEGFPKSLDVAKAIDQAGGTSPATQAWVLRTARERAGLSRQQVAKQVGCTAASVRDWEEGRARTRGGVVEYIIPSAEYRAALADLLGYSADERAIVGLLKADRREDGTVIGLGHTGVAYGQAVTEAAQQWTGWGTALKPACEPIAVGRKPLAGTVAANVLRYGTGALNIDGCRTATSAEDKAAINAKHAGMNPETYVRPAGSSLNLSVNPMPLKQAEAHELGRWPTDVLLDEHMAQLLDEQSGFSTSRVGKPRAAASGDGWGMTATGTEYDDEGGASRFYPRFARSADDWAYQLALRDLPVFRFEAKAPSAERPRVDGVSHPTVKPLALMRWLARLVTPPGGKVVDMFAGSGTTGEACLIEGFDCILIEGEQTYLPLIRHRVTKPLDVTLDIDFEVG